MQTRRQLLTSVGALLAAPALAALPVSTKSKPCVFVKSFCHGTDGYILVGDIYCNNRWVGDVICVTDPGSKDFAWKRITWAVNLGIAAFTTNDVEEILQDLRNYNRAFCKYFEKHQ